MKRDEWVLLGVVVVGYLYFRGSTSTTPSTYPLTGAGATGVATNPISSLFASIGNLFHPVATNPNSTAAVSQIPLATGGATDVTNINQIGPQATPANTTNYSAGCFSGGDVCDMQDCSYNVDICNEMNGLSTSGVSTS